MRKLKFFIGMIAMMFFAIGLSSCEKDSDFQNSENTPEYANYTYEPDSLVSFENGTKGSNNYFGWTYYPNTSYSYSYSNSGETKQGYGGTYYGGFMRASLIEKNDGYYVRITPANVGQTFGVNGTAYIKVGSLFGSYDSNYASFLSSSYLVDVPVTITLNKNSTFNKGAMNLWPVIITTTGSRKFTYPILIWTDPFYNHSTTTGVTHGYVDGVQVKRQPGGCVNFCKRYYESVYGMDLWNMSHAYTWWTTAGNYGLTTYDNGTTIPRVGDIVCWTGGTVGDYPGYGHIGIIFEVLDDKVKIVHQGTVAIPIGQEINRTGTDGKTLTNILSGDGYVFKGIIRKSGT